MIEAIFKFSVVLALAASFANAEEHCQTVTVLDQQIGSSNGGLYSTFLNGNLITVPINRSSNVVVVETARSRVTLSELGRKFVILSVHGQANMCQEDSRFVFRDIKGKKHKFGVIGLQQKPQEPQK